MEQLKKEQDRLITLQANKIRLLGGLTKEKEDIENQITHMTGIFDDLIQKQEDKIAELTNL